MLTRHWLMRPTIDHVANSGSSVGVSRRGSYGTHHEDHGVHDPHYIWSFFEDAPTQCLVTVLQKVEEILKGRKR